MRVEYEDIRGVIALLPTPASDNGAEPEARFTVDLTETRRAVNALVEDDVDALLLNGTFGEAATLRPDEWRQFTRTVVEAVDGRIPVFAGTTTLNTRTTIDRSRYARDVGADGVFLGRPMWCELSQDAIVDFYRAVADAVPEMGIVIYENPIHFKGAIEPQTWDRLAEIPQTLAAKYAGGVDISPGDLLERVAGDLLIMPIDNIWAEVFEENPDEAVACWSPSAACGPMPLTELRDALFAGDFERASEIDELMDYSIDVWWPSGDEFTPVFSRYNVPIEKIRFNHAGYMTAGPSRPPYDTIPEKYAEGARESGKRWQEVVEKLT